jgi:hypothetical protein
LVPPPFLFSVNCNGPDQKNKKAAIALRAMRPFYSSPELFTTSNLYYPVSFKLSRTKFAAEDESREVMEN